MSYLEEVDFHQPGFGDFYDELPLWSAPFGLLLLDRVPVRNGMTVLERRLNRFAAERGELTLTVPIACFEVTPGSDHG